MAPRARFELATLRLTAECSTIELPGSSGWEKSSAAQAKISLADAPKSVNVTGQAIWKECTEKKRLLDALGFQFGAHERFEDGQDVAAVFHHALENVAQAGLALRFAVPL